MQGAHQPVSAPADAVVFAFPRSLTWIIFGASLLFLTGAALAFFMGWTDRTHHAKVLFAIGALFAAFSVLGLRTCRRLRYEVAVNSEGIWYIPFARECIFMPWSDVANVSAQDTQQRLVLLDRARVKSIKLDYQLQNFGQLRDLVLQHTTALTHPDGTTPYIFHRTWMNKGVLLGMTALFVLIALPSVNQNQSRPSWVFIGFAGGCLLALTRDPTSVVITKEEVVIQYLGWNQKIPFETISGIVLRDMPDRGNVWAAVIIERHQGKPLRLFRFREGSIALRDALQAAWSSAKTPLRQTDGARA